MKKYIFILFSLLLCACSENEILNTMDSELTPEDSIITVRLNFVGDVQTEESSMTRAETDSKDIMGIIVGYNNTKKKYAAGLFDCWDNISLQLKAGIKYNFYCTMITDAKNKLGSRYSFNDSSFRPLPFFFFHGEHGSNSFFYGGNVWGDEDWTVENILKDNQATYSSTSNHIYCAPIERFYGEVIGYTPTVDGELTLSLKRVSFGIKVKVSGITDGSVSVTCKNNYNTFYSNSNITSNIESEGQLFSMYNIYDAWQYADTDYQEPVELSVVWTRGNGIVQNLGTKTAYVKRNVMNIIKVKLSKNDTDVDVDVDPEKGDMGGEEEDLSN